MRGILRFSVGDFRGCMDMALLLGISGFAAGMLYRLLWIPRIDGGVDFFLSAS